jgi:hypothetical protein
VNGVSHQPPIKVLLWGAVAWLLIFGIVLLYVAPDFPRTTVQWALLFVLGPPVYVLGEALGAWLFSPNRGHRISARRFSLFRIAYAVLVIALIVAAGGTLVTLIKGGT